MDYCNKLDKMKGNLKQYWRLIKEIINKQKVKSKLSRHFKDNDEIITDPDKIAKKLNEYFVNFSKYQEIYYILIR